MGKKAAREDLRTELEIIFIQPNFFVVHGDTFPTKEREFF